MGQGGHGQGDTVRVRWVRGDTVRGDTVRVTFELRIGVDTTTPGYQIKQLLSSDFSGLCCR